MVKQSQEPWSLEGRRLGPYVLGPRLGRGGMASVHVASLRRGNGFQRSVAIKVIHPHLGDDRRFVEMFLQEARIVSQLSHPHACAVLDVGEADGVPFLVMEHLKGRPLSHVMSAARKRQQLLPVWLVARIVADAARGLHAAHEQRSPDGEPLKLIHRDVSPDNIFVTSDGIAKICDFGIARARGSQSFTSSTELRGKIAYMAPEQIRKQPLDRTTDVWALGVILWEGMVGQRLFKDSDDVATAMRVLQQRIVPPSELRPDCPAQLDQLVLQALQRGPEARPSTAAELAAAIDRWLLGTGELTGPSQVGAWMTNFAPAEVRDASASRAGSEASTQPEQPEPQGNALGAPQVVRRARSHPYWKWGFAGVAVAAVFVGVVAGGDLPRPLAGSSNPALTAQANPKGAVGVVDSRAATARNSEALSEPVAASNRQPNSEASDKSQAREPSATVEGKARTATPTRKGATTSPAQRSARPRTQPIHRSGTLNLLVIPSAQVYWKGRLLGESPLVQKRLPAGPHRLTLRQSDGRAKRVTVVIRPENEAHYTIRMNGSP